MDPMSEQRYRFTFTITPATEVELQAIVDMIRDRFGRKHLIHVIGKQPSWTHVADAPSGAAEGDAA